MSMKLWELWRKEGADFDEAGGFVVRARTETAARKLASEQAGDEGAGARLDAQRASCEPLLAKGDAEVILRDFHAG